MKSRPSAQNQNASVHSISKDLSSEIVNAYRRGEQRHGFFFNHEDHSHRGHRYVLDAQYEWDHQYGPNANTRSEFDSWAYEDEEENESHVTHSKPNHDDDSDPIPRRPEGLHWSLVYLHQDQRGCQIIVTDAAQDSAGRASDLQDKLAFNLKSKLPQCKFIFDTSKRQEDSWNCSSFAISDYLALNNIANFNESLALVTSEEDLTRNCEGSGTACKDSSDRTGAYHTLCSLIPTTHSKKRANNYISLIKSPLDQFVWNHLTALNRTTIPKQSKTLIIDQLQELSRVEPENPSLRSSLLSSGVPVVTKKDWDDPKGRPMYWKDFLMERALGYEKPPFSVHDPVLEYGGCFNRATEAHFYNSDHDMNINSASYLVYVDQVKTILESQLKP